MSAPGVKTHTRTPWVRTVPVLGNWLEMLQYIMISVSSVPWKAQNRSHTWNRITEAFGNSLTCKRRHLPSFSRDVWNHTGNPASQRGALLQGESSPRRCSEQPLYAYWHHQERLGGRGYYGNQAMCWETEAFNCFNNFLGLELPGLDLLSRKWRLSQTRWVWHRARGLNEFWSYSLRCDFLMTNVFTWFH